MDIQPRKTSLCTAILRIKHRINKRKGSSLCKVRYGNDLGYFLKITKTSVLKIAASKLINREKALQELSCGKNLI